MMHERGKSDSAIVAVKPTNNAGQPAAEPAEPRTGTKRNAGEQSTHRTQGRTRVTQALARVRKALPSHSLGRRSYGAGGGGRGTFIVHTNRWRLPRGPSQ
jgi:hypothetical protein